MKTYYFGAIEFGDFQKGNDLYPVALVHRIDEVRDFADDEQADDYMVDQGFSAYLAVDAPIEIYFKRHA